MTGVRSWRGRFARIVGGVAVLAAVAAVGVAATAHPVGPDRVVTASVLAVPPAATTLVCPGPVVLPEADAGADAAFDPAPVDAVNRLRVAASAGAGASTSAARLLALGKPSGPVLAKADPAGTAGAVTGLVQAGVVVVRADPFELAPARVGASVVSVVTKGDLRGLAAATCVPPAADVWLVGGGTALGTSTVLSIQNPGSTPAEVEVALWGPSGRAAAAGSGSYLVAAGAHREIQLAALSAEQRALVVHVTAAGAQITAQLQVSRLRGLTPAGLDLVAAGQGPALRQVVSGLTVPASKVDDPDAAVVRLLAPGTSADEAGHATATLRLYGPKGLVVLPGYQTIDLPVGDVIDVSLAGLAAGAYTAVVTGDRPLLAGATISRVGTASSAGGERPVEIASAASVRAGEGGVVAIPPSVGASIVLSGIPAESADPDAPTGSAAGTLLAIGLDGSVVGRRDVAVAAGVTVTVPAASLAPGIEVAAVDLVVPADAALAAPRLAWSLVATATAADGELVSVLAPASLRAAVRSFQVLRSERVTLP